MVQYFLYAPKVKVRVKITETYENGDEVVVSETTELRDGGKELSETFFIFSMDKYTLMLANYSLGNCPITTKGLVRYSIAYGSGSLWYGQPAKAARELARLPIAIPKSLYGLMSFINGDS